METLAPPPGAPVLVVPPSVAPVALVCDSPHSGTAYPADFGFSVPMAELRQAEDTHVQWLWDAAPRVGATLVHATFPRSYIDANRSEYDIDVAMLADAWTGTVAPSPRSMALGNGLVSRATPGHHAIYARLLPASEVRRRIEHYWRPYRQALSRALQDTAVRHGVRWHLNLHSMPGNAYERLGRVAPGPLADVVLGDLHGSTCDGGFTRLVAAAFRQRGYSVALNDPYAGQDLVRAHGAPLRGHHSLQIELNRAIYLNEQTRELLPQAGQVRADVSAVLEDIAHHLRATAAQATEP